MLFVHLVLRADSRAACTAGNNRPMRTAMIAITTSNSIRVKPRRELTVIGDSSLADESDRLRGSIRWGFKLSAGNQTQPMSQCEEGAPSPRVQCSMFHGS